VYRRLRVAVFFTGDELRLPGEPLPPGAIYNSNRYALRALLEGLDCEVRDLGQIPDNLAATREALRHAGGDNDLIITSGGVSVGEEDHVKPAVEAEGRLALWKIAIKPGKPLAFGEVASTGKRTWFIGLPGNPVSSFLTFILLARPFILKLQGVARLLPQHYAVPADFEWKGTDGRTEFVRVRINADGRLEPFPHQGSGVTTSLVWSDGLARLTPGTAVKRGDLLHFIPFAEVL
jgi:molybdopterin molybdotransferase